MGESISDLHILSIRSCPTSVGRGFGSRCYVHNSCGFVYPGYTFIVSSPQKAVKLSPLTPKHKQQPKSNHSLRDNLPSLCLDGLLTRRGAHRGGSTRTRLHFTVFYRHFSDPYRFIACRENPLAINMENNRLTRGGSKVVWVKISLVGKKRVLIGPPLSIFISGCLPIVHWYTNHANDQIERCW